MPEGKVYLFDGTSFAYRAFYAIRGLTTSYGFPTNAIYGFARMFLKLFKEMKPEYAAVAFDVSRKTFREKISAEYKANRKPAPDDFKVQLPYIKKFLECLGIPVIEKEGYEADDILGTLGKKLSKEGYEVIIVSPDKDIRQLIEENIHVLSISPQKKTETLYTLELFKEKFGYDPKQIPDIFGLAGDTSDNIPGVPGIGEKTATKLIQEFGSLENLYKNLANLSPKRKKLLEDYREQAFMSKKLATIDRNVPIDVKPEDLKLKEPDAECLSELLKKLEMKSLTKEIKELFPNLEFRGRKLEEAKEIDTENFLESLKSDDLFSRKECAVIMSNNIFASAEKHYSVIDPQTLKEIYKKSGKIYTFNLKNLYHKTGISDKHKQFFDISIGEYLLNSIQKDYSPATIMKKYLETVEIEPIEKYAHHVIDVGKKIEEKLKKENLLKLYEKIEHPLIEVLYYMEKRGVLFDRIYMNNLKDNFLQKMQQLEDKIFSIAGESFNLNSPKQLSKILFEKLKIKPVKKTRTGYSTNVEVLTTLALNGYEIAELILEYRKYSKLLGTFIDGIAKHMDEGGRVHTNFIQTGTATGRLSSAEPNLQNLPVSDEISRQIRNAIIAPERYNLIWADYSQIELRVLAHLSGDERLIDAYKNNRDIHTETASILFGTEPEDVSPEIRKVAKMVNFGIIYGMSPQGLSQRLGISFNEAKNYIESYFSKFPTVKEFIEKTLSEAYEKGYVKTLFGRKRPVPELRAKNKNLRHFGERAAFNAIIQGTAADIMKMAMIELFKEFKKEETFLTLQVHDEIVMETLEEKAEKTKEKVKEIMENIVSLDVPLKVDIKIGKRWE
ncbi:DNA polymerase I [Desulfurobacterium indicum]|uniref:DNA polymerase I n=1 Tax=Desulfurobacterium indicum TaxID=1914305 RepID=A0A1R1MLD1_9BACT|nr:DNA polymerase I [Desulfurobacterium indicum]OMH40622.1 DNA polymerase I [Desulfurobacterium indicum]